MATTAQPRPAELPLPGGRSDAAVRIHPLLIATMTAPPGLFHTETGRLGTLRNLGIGVPRDQYVQFPVVAFLVEHPGVGNFLIDTGFHASVAVEPRQAFGRLGGLLYKDLSMETEQAAPGQLRSRGIDPASIGLVVMTHLHSDHASGISQFPDATFVLSDREWTAASKGGLGYFRSQFDHAFDYRGLDFDSPDADSFATFGRSYDLFDDGSVRLVFTPGHTHGHLAVVLRLKDREALIAGDAIYTMRTLREGALPPRMDDEHLFARSLREIQLYAKETPDAVIVPGHDLERWRELPEVIE
jgi:N-acyl homoserine lactone hydrolase